MGRVKRLIRLFEGSVTPLKRATRRSLFKSSAKPRAAKDHLHRTAQSARAPLFRRKPAPAAPEANPAKAPKRRPAGTPAKASAPVLATRRTVVPRQGPPPKAREPAATSKRPAWDFGEVKPREALEVAVQIGFPSPDSLQLQTQPRPDSQDLAGVGAAFTDVACRHDAQGVQPATFVAQLDTAAADPLQPAADPAPAPSESEEACSPLPWPAELHPAAEPAAAPLPLPAPAPLPAPLLPPPPPPPAEETKLLHVAPGFPADEVLWALRCQALCRGHPHLLQLREVEMQPQQLAVVIDRGLSTVQDLIDTTACMGAPASEAAVRQLFQQLVVGLAFCHRQGLARASVHPRHLTLHAPDGAPGMPQGAAPQLGEGCSLALKLHDFGAALAAATGGGHSGGAAAADIASWLCTEQDPSYSAPEVIEARLNEGSALPVSRAAADVWSAGAVLFALLAGGPPFSRPSDAALPPQPKAVATLLRINTGARNAVHGQVSEQCRDVLRLALEPNAARRVSVPALLAHPWVLRDMPAALRRVNAQLLAPAAVARATGPKRRHGGAPPAQAAKRAAIQTLETLLAARVDGPLRRQYGAAAAAVAAADPQQLPPVAEAAPADGATDAGSHPREQQPDTPPDSAPEAPPLLPFHSAVKRGTSLAAPPQQAAELDTTPPQPAAGDAAPAPASQPSTPAAQRPADSPAAAPEVPAAELESGAQPELGVSAAAPSAENSMTPDPQAAVDRELFDSPSSLKLLLAKPVAGSLRLRFGSRKQPALNGRIHSPLGWQPSGKADDHPHTLAPCNEAGSGPATPRKPEAVRSASDAAAAHGDREGEAAAAAGAGGCGGVAAVAELSDDDSPRFLAAAALAEALAEDYNVGTGFQRFSNDSAYRQKVQSAKLAAAHIRWAGAEPQPSVARALDFGSCSTSGGASPAASHSRAACGASQCSTPLADSPRSPIVAAAHPAAARVPAVRPAVPLLRLDRLPALLAPLAEAEQASGAAGSRVQSQDTSVAGPQAATGTRAQTMERAAPPAVHPLNPKVSGAELCSTSALVRLVAAAAFAARNARGGSSGGDGASALLPGTESGASWGGASLQQRQDRALEHSGRLHACYMSLLAAGGPAS